MSGLLRIFEPVWLELNFSYLMIVSTHLIMVLLMMTLLVTPLDSVLGKLGFSSDG